MVPEWFAIAMLGKPPEPTIKLNAELKFGEVLRKIRAASES